MPYPVITKADLLSQVPLKPNDDNVISFVNAAARESYFNGKVFMAETNIQYMKEQDDYLVAANYDDVIANCNYLRFNNENRWFYAFIMSVRYINPGTCAITFQIDYWTTYQFDLQWKNCFIEREHVSDDTIGKHTISENLYTGEFVKEEIDINYPSGVIGSYSKNIDLCPVILLSESPTETPSPSSTLMNGLIEPCVVWYTDAGLKNAELYMANFLSLVSAAGKADAIIASYSVPKYFISQYPSVPVSGTAEDLTKGKYLIAGSAASPSAGQSSSYKAEWSQSITVSGLGAYFSIKNNKLYTHEFFKLILDNNQGSLLELNPELLEWDGSRVTIDYSMTSSISPDTTTYLKISNYGNGVASSIDAKDMYCLPIGKYPKNITSTNFYTNWIAGHSASLNTSYITSALNTIGGIATGNASYIAGGITDIVSKMAKETDLQIVPDVAKGSIGNVGNVASERLKYSLYMAYPNFDYLQSIDFFLSMYGYKVNRVGTPAFRTRQYYNYYKLPVCNVFGNVPGEGIKSITEMFQNGVTVWNTTDVGNYRNCVNPIV